MVKFEGADAFHAALLRLGARTTDNTLDAIEQGAIALRDRIQENLSRQFYPPSSPPGDPPAYRGGALFDSVLWRVAEISDSRVQARVYPSTVYARIQELGGIAGAGYRTRLEPRPYVRPAIEEISPQVQSLLTRAWADAMRG